MKKCLALTEGSIPRE